MMWVVVLMSCRVPRRQSIALIAVEEKQNDMAVKQQDIEGKMTEMLLN